MNYCQRCKKEVQIKRVVSRNDQCPHCDADLRSCLNCRHFSPGAHLDCRENISEAVRDKERANFCDYFSFSEKKPASGSSSFSEKRDKARHAFDDLFS